MKNRRTIYTFLLSGPPDKLEEYIRRQYADCDVRAISREDMHRRGLWGRIRRMRDADGEALVFSLEKAHPDGRIPNEVLIAGLASRCRSVVVLAGPDQVSLLSRRALRRRLPRFFMGGLLDALTIGAAFLVLHALRLWLRKPGNVRTGPHAAIDVTHLYPLPQTAYAPGGEASYLCGTLAGFAEAGIRAEVISSVPIPTSPYPVHIVATASRYALLREASALRSNWRFYRAAKEQVARRRPCVLYQRHHSFVFCGVLVSQLTGIPLIVEYQNSELWRANNWDPCHFRGLLKIAEDLTLRCAHGFVALSTVLRDELVAQGARPERILVNPAAADIAKFFPGCGDGKTRQRLGFLKNDVVVCFLGTFSYYHGVTVLQKAIAELLQKRQENDQTPRLKFLLIGDGVLRPQMAEELNVVKGADAVMFTGSVQHDAIPLMLDAADILVSPHVPLEDGSAFFGSPTKLFEYMAAGKAIVASNMFQIAEVMQHGKTAWLVTPGSHSELAEAIEMLAGNPVIRSLLGANARAAVLDRHLWRHNGERVLSLSRSLTKEG